MKNNKIYPWVVVALLWVVALLNYMDRQMLSTMQASIGTDIDELNPAKNPAAGEMFGVLMGAFLYVYGVVSPFAGMIADRLSRKWLLVGSLFVWSAVTFLMGWAETFDQLYVLRALMGVSEALYIPSALSLIADWHDGKSRSLAIGVHMTGLYVGQAIGGFGAAIAAMCSWHEAFHWFGIIGMVYAVVLILALKENPAHAATLQMPKEGVGAKKPSLLSGLAIVASTWAFWVILFYFAVSSLPGWGIKNWSPTLFAESLGMDMQLAGPICTITIAASSLVGVLLGGMVSDRWVQHHIRGRVYTSAIGLGMTVPALVLLGLSHNSVAIICAGLLFGIGYGMFDANNMPILCQFVSAKYRATAYGIMNMTGVFAGAAVTTWLGKWTDGGNLGLSFAIMGGVVLVALVMQLSFLRPKTDNMQ